jgi:uncharacterized membrane protein
MLLLRANPFTATVNALNGFGGSVGLSVSGLPAGATGSFSPTSVTGNGSSTLTITTTSSVAAGTYPLTITGTSGTLTRTSSVNFVISDFSVNASPASQTINPAGSTTFTATVNGLSGFSSSVGLSVSGLPSGATGVFTPASVTGSGASTLDITTVGSVAAGTYPLTITGTSGTLIRTTAVTLVINATVSPDFSLSVTPSSRTIDPGYVTTYTVTVNGMGGFTAGVNLTVSGLPQFATASFNPSSITPSNSSTLTITTAHRGPSGTFNLTITGTSGAMVRTTNATLVVIPSMLLMSSPASRTIPVGGSTTYSVSVNALGGFTGVATMSVSGVPAGVTAVFNPGSVTVTGSSTLTVTTDASVLPGTYVLTATATSGTLSRSTTLTLVITP